jgi:plastocyanin
VRNHGRHLRRHDRLQVDTPAPNCDPAWAGCTEADFNAGDMTAIAGTINIGLVGSQPYSPTCVRVQAGQAVTIEATAVHPFEKVCAEDSVMDLQHTSTSAVTFTFTSPGYYNYRCLNHPSSMVGNIQVVP